MVNDVRSVSGANSYIPLGVYAAVVMLLSLDVCFDISISVFSPKSIDILRGLQGCEILRARLNDSLRVIHFTLLLDTKFSGVCLGRVL